MHCKCALECEYKIVNLEQHVCHHDMSVCSLLEDRAVTIWTTVDWDRYWQPNEYSTAMHIHKPATGRCSHRTSAVHPLCAMGKRCIWAQECIVSLRARVKIIARHIHSARIRVTLQKMNVAHLRCPQKDKNYYAPSPRPVWNLFYFSFPTRSFLEYRT